MRVAYALLTGRTMRLGLRGTVLALLVAGCGEREAKDLQAGGGFVDYAGARATGESVQAAVEFVSSREALAPLSLREVIAIDAEADREARVELPVPFSTQAVWARVSMLEPGTIVVDGARVSISTDTLVAFPISRRALRFRAERSGRVMLQPIAAVDSAGGGFELKAEAPVAVEVGASSAPRLVDPPAEAPDDTFARLMQLEVASDQDNLVKIGRCSGASDVPTSTEALLSISAGRTSLTTAWLPGGPLCFSALQPARLTLKGLGRVRRFARTSLRAVRPVTVLDTARGAGGWSGRPGLGQELRASLTGLSEGAEVIQRVFSVTLGSDAPAGATAVIGACGSAGTKVSTGGMVLLPPSDALCVSLSGRFDVQVSLLAEVTPRSEAPGQCGARPPAVACEAVDVLGRLNCIPGVSATAYSSPRRPAGTEQFLLRITQPADHFRPDGATFQQRALLTLRSETAPLVLHTTGYELFEYASDLFAHFPTNELEVEHRFFEDSTPTPRDYSTLTIMQSAYDSHRIVELLSPVLTGPWVNTGHSKGGMTALYHRRFFPCDVVGSAPYVTPLSLGKQDARFGPWVAELGGPAYAECRQVTKDLERGVIAGRAQFAPALRGTYQKIGGRENALWAAMNGASLWGAFQSGQQDDPDRGCPAYLALKNSPDFPLYVEYYSGYAEAYSDESLSGPGELNSYTYQTQNELGAPGHSRGHLEEYGPIPQLPDDNELAFMDVPLPQFEARAMPDVQGWLSQHGERFFFLYGGFDPWSAAQVDAAGEREGMKFVVPGASHGVSIEDMPEPERQQAFQLLEGWLGVERLRGTPRSVHGKPLLRYRDVMGRHAL
ncbi:MAG: hypothetical protein AMXMBFR34_14270 [Myxococcaceae bacterium]